MSRLASWIPAFVVVAVPASAAAHISLTAPVVRIAEQKIGPCGTAGSVRGTNVTVLEPGAMFEVRWTEPINHPSHYRISFDLDGQDFTVPNAFMDFTQTENVLVDNIADAAGGSYSQMIQLPSTPCENCTLQLIQMMYDKAPYGDGNDIYFQCADIALRVGGGPGPGPDAGGSAGGDGGTDPVVNPDETITGGCATTGTDSRSSWIIVALALSALLIGRRRPISRL